MEEKKDKRVNFEVKQDDRSYIFSMPSDSTLGQAYDAAFRVLQEIVTMSKQAMEKAAPQAENPEVAEGSEEAKVEGSE